MDHLARLAFVVAQLSAYAGEKKNLSGSTLVSCPFHKEKTPSFRIYHSPGTRSPGYGKCYGCGQTSSWDGFATKLGLKPLKYTKPTEVFASSLVLEEDEDKAETLTFAELPDNRAWRGIKTSFLKDVGAKKCTNKYGTSFVYLPVSVLGRERGYVKARLRKIEGSTSYINSKGGWAASSGLFLYDWVRAKSPRVVILVEGPRDGLRLCYHGLPTISILGTQSWSDRKSRYIELLGVDTVILAMDGDDAGLAAVDLITPKLEPFVKVVNFSLTGRDSPYWKFRKKEFPSKAAKAQGIELWDPGNMPQKKLEELREMVALYT